SPGSRRYRSADLALRAGAGQPRRGSLSDVLHRGRTDLLRARPRVQRTRRAQEADSGSQGLTRRRAGQGPDGAEDVPPDLQLTHRVPRQGSRPHRLLLVHRDGGEAAQRGTEGVPGGSLRGRGGAREGEVADQEPQRIPVVDWKKVACGAFFGHRRRYRRQKAWFLPAAQRRRREVGAQVHQAAASSRRLMTSARGTVKKMCDMKPPMTTFGSM